MRYQDFLTWQRIYEWSLAQPAGAIIGTSCTNVDCPLARYMQAMTGLRWSVGPTFKCLDQDICLEKAEWLWNLTRLVDELTGDRMGPISRERFLAVLMKVKGEGV